VPSIRLGRSVLGVRRCRVRLAALLLVAPLVAGGCSVSTSSDANRTDTTTGGGTTGSAAGAGTCSTGLARDLDSALAILTDPPGCAGSLNSYWRQQLGSRWTPVRFIGYEDGDVPSDACGAQVRDPRELADNAFYCPQDDTIAYSKNLLSQLYETGGPYLPVVVLEHELGHRANALADVVGVVPRAEENQADCDAGVTTKYARKAGRLPFSDVVSSAQLLYKLGDRRRFGQEQATDPSAHGTPGQRLVAFTKGYTFGLGSCRKLGQREDGKTL